MVDLPCQNWTAVIEPWEQRINISTGYPGKKYHLAELLLFNKEKSHLFSPFSLSLICGNRQGTGKAARKSRFTVLGDGIDMCKYHLPA